MVKKSKAFLGRATIIVICDEIIIEGHAQILGSYTAERLKAIQHRPTRFVRQLKVQFCLAGGSLVDLNTDFPS